MPTIPSRTSLARLACAAFSGAAGGAASALAALALLMLLAAAPAHAAVGLAQIEVPGLQGPVTLYYPTVATPERVTRGPFQFQLAPGAEPARGNGRLTVISHGSGGG